MISACWDERPPRTAKPTRRHGLASIAARVGGPGAAFLPDVWAILGESGHRWSPDEYKAVDREALEMLACQAQRPAATS